MTGLRGEVLALRESATVKIVGADYEVLRGGGPDDRDTEIAERRIAALRRDAALRVGDWVEDGGELRRVAHIWRDEADRPERIQVEASGGSYYLGDGYASMSGGLESGFPYGELERTGGVRPAVYWFFHHDYHTAHYGITVEAPAPVWRREKTEKGS